MSVRNTCFLQTKYSGFTLVELIVVITILAILGTIGFIQLWGFAGSARDSVRISNLTNLKKGLDLSQIQTGVYPLPESSVNITASGTIIGYQWFAKEQVEWVAKLSAWATKDPSDTTMYTTYSTNANQTKMQAMVFLEDGGSVSAFLPPLERGVGGIFPTANASSTSDYSKRFPSTTGDSLGILLSNSGVDIGKPVQEISSIANSGSLDILTSTGSPYKAIISNTLIISGTGNIFIPLLTNYDSTIGTYPGCDMKDIKLPNGQIWAACNVGATAAWKNQTFPSATGARTSSINTWAGGLYQWGNNADISVAWTGGAQTVCSNVANSYNTATFIQWFTDWCTTQSDNMWGDTDNTMLARRGPCAPGYHVPTTTEWGLAPDSILWKTLVKTPLNTPNTISPEELSFFQNILHIPMSGGRGHTDGTFILQGQAGFYWSSSLNTTEAQSLLFAPGAAIYPTNFNPRTFWITVRCIKN